MNKQTSPHVSKIVAKLLGAGNPLDTTEGRAAAREALKDCGLPMNDRAANGIIDKFADIIEPFVQAARSAAGSALSQDETPKAKTPIDDITEEQRREHFFNPDGDGEP